MIARGVEEFWQKAKEQFLKLEAANMFLSDLDHHFSEIWKEMKQWVKLSHNRYSSFKCSIKDNPVWKIEVNRTSIYLEMGSSPPAIPSSAPETWEEEHWRKLFTFQPGANLNERIQRVNKLQQQNKPTWAVINTLSNKSHQDSLCKQDGKHKEKKENAAYLRMILNRLKR